MSDIIPQLKSQIELASMVIDLRAELDALRAEQVRLKAEVAQLKKEPYDEDEGSSCGFIL